MAKKSRAKRASEDKKPTKKKEVNRTVKKIAQLPSSLTLLRESLKFLYRHKKKLLGVVGIFLILYMLVGRIGIGSGIDSTQQLISDELGDSSIVDRTTRLWLDASESSEVSSIGTFIVLIIGSLAFIWTVRSLEAGKKFKVRDAYYKGMYPLIPFLLIIFLIWLQFLLPTAWGVLYALAENKALITTFIERGIFFSVWIALTLMAAYWATNSLMAMYAVTLPNIYPMQALRSTKKALKGRRWSVVLKVFVLLVFLIVVSVVGLLGVALLMPVVAVFVFDLLLVLALLFAHVYLFKLYRSLL